MALRLILSVVVLGQLACGRINFGTNDFGTGECVSGERIVSIADNFDDGELAAGLPVGTRWYPSGEPGDYDSTFIGNWDGAPIWGYFRFVLPDGVPEGAQIIDARLTMSGGGVVDNGGTWEVLGYGIEIAIEDTSNAAQVDAEDDVPGGTTGVVLASGTVRWPPSGGLVWPQSGARTTPDLTPLVSTIHQGTGITPGASLQFWLRGIDIPSTENTEVAYWDFSTPGTPMDVAQLSIWLSCP